jgi:hypothetical protein
VDLRSVRDLHALERGGDVAPSKEDSDELPVTAEVGSEGGSYTDAIQQEATREGNLPRVDESVSEASSRLGQLAPATTATTDDPEDGVHRRERNDDGREPSN